MLSLSRATPLAELKSRNYGNSAYIYMPKPDDVPLVQVSIVFHSSIYN